MLLSDDDTDPLGGLDDALAEIKACLEEGDEANAVRTADEHFADESLITAAAYATTGRRLLAELPYGVPDALPSAGEAATSVLRLLIELQSQSPTLERFPELTARADDRFDDPSEVVTGAVSAFLGLEGAAEIRIEAFDRYRVVVDSLLENDDYPCETVDDVVEAALEAYLLELE